MSWEYEPGPSGSRLLGHLMVKSALTCGGVRGRVHRCPWSPALLFTFSPGFHGLCGSSSPRIHPDRCPRFAAVDRGSSAVGWFGECGVGVADEEALGAVAAFCGEEVPLCFGFHAFGGDAEVEFGGHAQDGAHDGGAAGAGGGRGGERAVDFDLGDRDSVAMCVICMTDVGRGYRKVTSASRHRGSVIFDVHNEV